MSEELSELRKISKILILVNAKAIETELSKCATSDERKKIWVLINAERMSKDIAQLIGVTVRSVNRFLNILENAELIVNPWGKPPQKIIDYVPPAWLELVELEPSGEKEES